MDRVYTVSFPRSGHYLLMWILEEYFGDQFAYCDNFQHCTSIPCKDPRNNYHKNHDFSLTSPKQRGEKYLTQVRHPYESIASWFELALPKAGQAPFADTKEEWDRWLEEKINYWRGFVSKWIFSNQPSTNKVILYHDLTDCLYSNSADVIEYMNPGVPIDQERLGNIVEGRLRNELRDVRSFRYFDEQQLADTEARVSDCLVGLEIPSLRALN